MKISKLLPQITVIILSVFIAACTDEAPICEITSPLSGSEIEQGEVVTISVDAEDSDGSVTDVKFFIDGSGVGLATNFPYNFEWNTKEVVVGNHTILTKAQDDNGNISEDEVSIDIIGLVKTPSVETQLVINISTTIVTLNGEVSSDGGATITERGFYWSKIDQTPDDGDNVEIVAGTTGEYSFELNSLDPNTSYYFIAFATNTKGASIGDPMSFTTQAEIEPSVKTKTASNIVHTSATLNGEVSSDGGATISERGFYWSKTNNTPNSANNIEIVSGTTGEYSFELNSLDPNTSYYFIAFATNTKGASIGDPLSFTTPAETKPSVETKNVSNIVQTSATLNGEATSDGGATISERGFYWSKTEQIPDSGDNIAIVLGTTGKFSFSLTGLDYNTPYYYVAFATNANGTDVGDSVSFKTEKKEIEYGKFIDSRDENTYKTIENGGQIWMAENLAYLPNVSPSSADSYTVPYYYVLDYEGLSVSEAKATDKYETYGVLYNWTAATNACPNGWHLPSDEEWKQLEMNIGMSQIQADKDAYRGTNEGEKLKATSGWNSNGNGTDEFGFSALPGARRSYGGSFTSVGNFSYWWSDTEYDSSYAWFRSLYYSQSGVNRLRTFKDSGFSVRCVKD